ncbi:MAG TPA: FMN-binding glutamate synthase family protein [Casimicrobiaceae bacterium]|nr:FMN-binding glutamate synthase family protein [Casimicrobiaceae bacterium]
MADIWSIVKFGLSSLVALLIFGGLLVLFVRDITQKKHTVLRNYPIIGHFRYWFEQLGEYFRQYFFANDREEMPFNRATRAWIYRLAKNEGGTIGFGSTYDLHAPGALIFVNAPFPVLESERLPTPPMSIGDGFCRVPFIARSIVNISGMSFGAISEPAVRALSRGAKEAGCWLDTGEGGLSPFHLEGGCDVIMQIGTAKYGVRDAQGHLDEAKLREIAAIDTVRAFEIKLSQGAKPGKGGVLPGAKVTPLIASIRGIPAGMDSISPNRHIDIANMDQLLEKVARVRDLTGKPVGVKTAVGGRWFANDLAERILARGLEFAPDFLVIDGGEGGSGAAPQALADHVGLSIDEALPRVIDALEAAGIKDRVKVVASGKLVTSARAAWALCCGADFVNTARGFMFALGCIQALRCHTNTCPTGITTHNPRLQRGLVIDEKYVRVASYALNMNKEIDMIAHSCGVRQARELMRRHVRLVQPTGGTIALDVLYPHPTAAGAARPSLAGTMPQPSAPADVTAVAHG